jgi:tetratricopeptide (TPR) repeat protein
MVFMDRIVANVTLRFPEVVDGSREDNMKRVRHHLGRVAAASVAVLAAACASVAFEPDRAARAPLLEGFGAHEARITTSVVQARRLFEQGMALAWAFNHDEAVRSFKAALAADPTCAMCAWGVAWQLGPNINEKARDKLKAATQHLDVAVRHAPAATPRERELIAALAVRYAHASQQRETAPLAAAVCGKSGASDGRSRPLDLAYAQRLEAMLAAYPDDADIVTLWAEATMVAHPRLEWPSRPGAAPPAELQELATRLERALQVRPEHLGLNHYLIHVMDHPSVAARALPAAERIGRLAPGAPHLVHMPSHTYAHLGRYAEAMRANEQALQAERAYHDRARTQGFEPADDWRYHNQHFLWFAALMAGQGDQALAAARRNAGLFGAGKEPYDEYIRSLPLLTLARLERWEEVLREPAPAGQGVALAVTHSARGLAHARLGRLPQAKAELAALEEALPRLRSDQAASTPRGRWILRGTAEVLAGRLEAEVAAGEGRWSVAEAHLRRTLRAAAPFDSAEPAMLGAGMRVALGELLLRAGKGQEAEEVFREELLERPDSGWALRGLAQAARAQKLSEQVASRERELDRVWAGADTSLRTLR